MDKPDFHDPRIVLEDGIQTLKPVLGSSDQPAQFQSVTSIQHISKMKAVQHGSTRFNPFPHIPSHDNPTTRCSKRLGIPDGDRDRPGRQKNTH